MEGSPTGSPHAGGAGATVDGAELARRMMAATEAASAATQLAARALEELKTATERTSENKDWYKLLSKPSSFDPSSREAEISGWRDWSWSFEQYLGSLDSVFTEEIRVIRNNIETVVDTTAQSNAEMRRGSFLYGLLASLLKQRPLMVLKAVGEANGYEAYRQLIASNEPHSKNRSMSLLNLIMNWPSFNAKSSLLSQIMKLENAYAEYERLGTALAEEIRSAVLMRCLTGQLKVWLQLQINETTTYLRLRELIVGYERSTSKWTESMVLGSDAVVDSSAPMEVDRVQHKGKGKGKDGKGKGYKGKDGKGKDSFKGKSKMKGGKQQSHFQNQFQKSSGKSWSGHSKGKDQSRDKGKGYGGKSNAGGKGQTISCWTCGGNHRAENCWKNQHVRNVVDEQQSSGEMQQGSSHIPQSQSSNSQAASSSQHPSSSGNNASSSASTSYRVSRIAYADTDTDTRADELIFDLGGLSDFGKLSIRAVCDESFSSRVGVEHFFIGSDDDSCEHDSCSSLLHQDIYDAYGCDWSVYGVQSCDLSIYDGVEMEVQCLRDDRPWKPSGVEGSRFHACQAAGPHFKHVRAVTSDDHITEFLIDSGSDATVVPISYAHYGIPYSGESRLVDCQGNALSTAGLKEFRFIMQSVDGRTISFREVGHLSASVSCPLVSFGRLFKNGWRIGGNTNDPLLEHPDSGVAVAMSFRNESFVVPGFIRQLAQVNAVSIKVPEAWKALNPGWHSTSKGLPLCRSNGTRYIDASKRYSPSEFPFRATICLRDSGWEMVEHCARYVNKDPARLKPLEARAAISVFSREWVDIEEMGLSRISSSSSSSPAIVASNPASSESSRPVHTRRGGAIVEEISDSGSVDGDVVMPDQHDVQEHAPVDEQQQDQPREMQRPEIPDAAEQHVSVRVDRDSIEVNGVRLTAESPIATLRAACKYVGTSSSGGKKKLFDRIVSFYDQQQLSIAQEVQASLEAPVVAARPQVAVQQPTPVEVRDHQLTHIPYQQWCEACVQGKARPDSHFASPERRTERSTPRLSFDLSFTGKDHRVGGPPQLVEAEEMWKEKIVVLNCHDSATGMVAAIPVRRKADIHYMTREVAKFARGLGVGELELHCDNEPTMLQLLSLLQRTLIKLGLVVTTSTSKPRDHGGNAYAEQTVHRVRQNAMVLLAQVEINLGYAIPINHPISTWAFKHAGWIINRFIGRSGQTPYFLVHGHDYTGKCCPFGEVVMAYVADDRRQKGSARWAHDFPWQN